jgi:hypothetical protein
MDDVLRSLSPFTSFDVGDAKDAILKTDVDWHFVENVVLWVEVQQSKQTFISVYIRAILMI